MVTEEVWQLLCAYPTTTVVPAAEAPLDLAYLRLHGWIGESPTPHLLIGVVLGIRLDALRHHTGLPSRL